MPKCNPCVGILAEEEQKNVNEIIYRRDMFQELSKPNENGMLSKTEEFIWFEVQDPVKLFVGRESILTDLHESLQSTTILLTVVCGLAGVGKTELARKYVQGYFSFYESNIIWINSDTEETIKQSVSRLVKEHVQFHQISLHDKDGEPKSLKSLAKEIYNHISPRACLFIFDNAENFESLKNALPLYFPTQFVKPSILITSTNRNEWRNARIDIETLELSCFTEKEAIYFTQTALKSENVSQIAKFVKQLDNFPLVLMYAVTFITGHNEEMQLRNKNFTIADFLANQEEIMSQICYTSLQVDRYTKTVFETFEIIINKIFKNIEYGSQAFDMLSIIAYLENQNVPEFLFLHLMAGLDSERQISITGLLRKYSLVNIKNGMICIHASLQQVIRIILENEKKEAIALDRALTFLLQHMKDRNSIEFYIPHIISVWKYAVHHDSLIDKFISNISKNVSCTTYFHLIVGTRNPESVQRIIIRIKNIFPSRLSAIVNEKDSNRGRPLHNAAAAGNAKIVRVLIESGAQVNVKKKHEWTPLHLAAKYGHDEVVSLLLEKGANIHAKTGYKFSALHLAIQNEHIGTTNILLANNADINCKTRQGSTPLHFAVEKNLFSIFQLLIDQKADCNVANTTTGMTVLHMAILNCNHEILKILLVNNADVNAKTTQGNTALHLASEKGDLQGVMLLIESNADINVKNTENLTPFDLATKNGHIHVTKYINSKQNESISNAKRSQTFKRRQGTSGLKGQLYEINLAMLFFFQGLQKTKEGILNGFSLATNVENAGDFDDVVFNYKYTEKCGLAKSIAIFLQAKHREDDKKEKVTLKKLLSDARKGDFNLKSYFNSYRKIKQQCLTENPNEAIFSHKLDNCDFIIYTNAIHGFDCDEKVIQKHNISGDFVEHFLNYENIYESDCFFKFVLTEENIKTVFEVLQYCSDCKKIISALTESMFSTHCLDITSNILKDYHSLLAQQVIQVVGKGKGRLLDSFLEDEKYSWFRKVLFEEIQKQEAFHGKSVDEGRLKSVNLELKLCESFGKIKEQSLYMQKSLPNDLVSLHEVEDFLLHLKIFCGQPSEIKLEEIIKEKLRLHYRLGNNEIKTVFCEVQNKIQNWWKLDNNWLTEKATFVNDAIRISIFFDVRDPVELYTGRKIELEKLHSALQRNQKLDRVTIISQMTAISGLGGIGKTEFARQYISLHSSDYDNNILWINAENYMTSTESFQRLAKEKLGIQTKTAEGEEKSIKAIVEEVYTYFSNRKCLFVFDNADNYNVGNVEKIESFFKITTPGNKPYILITSRSQIWDLNVEILQLDVFTDSEALEFVKRSLKLETDSKNDEILQLTKMLGCFPLALKQAVAYIFEENKKMEAIGESFEIKDYLIEYSKKEEQLLHFNFPDTNGYTRTTFITWMITFKRIQMETHGQLAVEIMEIMAYFAPDVIFTPIFLSKVKNKSHLGSALRLLQQYSMITLEKGVGNVHRLVQHVLRIHLKNRNEDIKVLEEALKLMEHQVRNDDKSGNRHISHAVAVWDHCSHHKFLVERYSKMPSHIVEKLVSMVRYAEAFDFAERGLQLLVEVIGSTNLSTLDVQNSLALVLDKQGKWEEALNVYKDVVQRKKDILGKDHSDTLKSEHALAWMLDRTLNYSEALDIFNKILEIRRTKFGENDPDTLATQDRIAWILINQAKFESALEMLNDVFRKKRDILGLHNIDTAYTRYTMAEALTKQGDIAKALEIHKEVWNVRKDILGSDHPVTLDALKCIGQQLYYLGKYEEAMNIFRDIYEKRKVMLGENHVSTLGILDMISMTYYRQGEYQKALKIYSLKIYREKRRSLNIQHNIAMNLEGLGKDSDALNINYSILEKLTYLHGEDHPKTLNTEHNIARMIMCNKQKYQEALNIFRRILQNRCRYYKPYHKGILKVKLFITLLEESISNSTTPLHCAAAKGHLDVIAYILRRKGANINETDDKGNTSLISATMSRNIKAAEMLIDKGANINVQNNDNETALHLAAKQGQQEMVKLLLNKNANTRVVNKDGKTPLTLVKEKLHQDLADYGDFKEIAELLNNVNSSKN